jgi:hypothetical protein
LFMVSFQSQTQVSQLHKFIETEFQVITDVSLLPIGIDTNQVMANPQESWNETDAGIIGFPHHRLIFAGKSGSLCFVYYEQGGFECSTNLVLFEQKEKVPTTLWAGRLHIKKMPNLSKLKEALAENTNQLFIEFPRSLGIVYLQK